MTPNPGHGRKGPARRSVRRRRIATTLALAAIFLAFAALFFWGILPGLKPRFNGQQAFGHLVRQCDFGPRAPGTEAHRRCLDYLTAELKRHAHRVTHQTFPYTTKKAPGSSLQGTNIVASVFPESRHDRRILLCAHWDSRPFADRDPDPARRKDPVMGANDGASGVAVLLEMARVLKGRPPQVGVDIVLFDLEDMGEEDADRYPGGRDPFCIGSEQFVASNPEYRPHFGILLDMVGKKDLRIRKEGFSWEHAPQVVEMVWRVARRVGARAFVWERGGAIQDDHVPFLKRGIPVVDLIDLDYPHWHTTHDTPDKCDPQSLQQVGDVLLEVIYREAPRFSPR